MSLCPYILGDQRCGVRWAHPNYTRGCDKTADCCGGRFQNLPRYGGTPDLAEKRPAPQRITVSDLADMLDAHDSETEVVSCRLTLRTGQEVVTHIVFGTEGPSK